MLLITPTLLKICSLFGNPCLAKYLNLGRVWKNSCALTKENQRICVTQEGISLSLAFYFSNRPLQTGRPAAAAAVSHSNSTHFGWFNNSNVLWTQQVTFWCMEVAVVSVNWGFFCSSFPLYIPFCHYVLLLGFPVSVDAAQIARSSLRICMNGPHISVWHFSFMRRVFSGIHSSAEEKLHKTPIKSQVTVSSNQSIDGSNTRSSTDCSKPFLTAHSKVHWGDDDFGPCVLSCLFIRQFDGLNFCWSMWSLRHLFTPKKFVSVAKKPQQTLMVHVQRTLMYNNPGW